MKLGKRDARAAGFRILRGQDFSRHGLYSALNALPRAGQRHLKANICPMNGSSHGPFIERFILSSPVSMMVFYASASDRKRMLMLPAAPA
jgi:hypothetical protein